MPGEIQWAQKSDHTASWDDKCLSFPRDLQRSDSLSTLKCVLGNLKQIGQFVKSEMCLTLRKVETDRTVCQLGNVS